ncbi:hypothetical protein B0H16DRAFT_1551007, partial [Mycena metata]
AGLFSGSLTAFLIESYRSLTPDPASTAVLILSHLSHQIAGNSNGTVLVNPSALFVPPASALICNTLWFLSLGLSLSCALVATLLEQWARNFLHRAELSSAPVIRARMFSFLYYGLKRFNMHTVVEIVPLLLHAALICFFGGLIAFLAPINRQIMFLSAALFGVLVACYLLITILPLLALDCPYHTPLSGALWRLTALLRISWGVVRYRFADQRNDASAFRTMIAAISHLAMEDSAERGNRDHRALIWTLNSLADENELEPLVESIPDLLWGPRGRRYLHDETILRLVVTPDVDLSGRIEGLLLSCDSGLLSHEAVARRQTMCFKALWCIASLTEPLPSQDPSDGMFNLSLTGRVPFSENSAINHYAVSTRALTRWNNFCSIQIRVLETLRYIRLCQDTIRTGQVPDLKPALTCIDRLQMQESFFVPYWQIEGLADAKENIPAGAQATSLWLQKLFYCLQSFHHDIPHLIFFDYLEQATNLDRLPYAYHETLNIFRFPDRPLSSLVRSRLEWIIKEIVDRHLDSLHGNAAGHWIDEILALLASFWVITEGDRPTVSVPNALLQYMRQRNSYDALSQLVVSIDCNSVWSCIITNVITDSWAATPELNSSLIALWHLCELTLKSSHKGFPHPGILDSVLSCAVALETPSSSVVALLKATLLDALTPSKNIGLSIEQQELWQRLIPKIFPPDATLSDMGPELNHHDWYRLRDTLEIRTREGYVGVLTEFMESFAIAGSLPYNAAETLALLDPPFIPASPRKIRVQNHMQIRFADGVHSVFSMPRENTKILEAVADLQVFNVKIGEDTQDDTYMWLNDSTACKVICESLDQYLAASSQLPSSYSPSFIRKLHGIVEKLERTSRGVYL